MQGQKGNQKDRRSLPLALILISSLIVSFCLGYGTAEAAYSQPVFEDSTPFQNDVSLISNQRFGTGHTGAMGTTSMRARITGTNNATNDVVIQMFEYSNSNYTTFTNGWSCVAQADVQSSPSFNNSVWYSCVLSGTFNSSRYYALNIIGSGPGSPEFDGYAFGSDDPNSYTNGYATTTNASVGGVHGPYLPIQDFAFYIGTTPPPDTFVTQIKSYSPVTGSYATTSTSTTISFTVQINENDIGASLEYCFSSLNNILTDEIIYGDGCDDTYSWQFNSEGEFTVSTTTPVILNQIGTYQYTAHLAAPCANNWFDDLIDSFLARSSCPKIFTPSPTIVTGVEATLNMGGGTVLGNAVVNTLNAADAFLLAANDSSTSSPLVACNAIILGAGSVPDCIYALIIPSPQQIGSVMTNFKNDVMLKAPWGYATRVYTLLSGDVATTTLPSLEVTLPSIAGNYEGMSIDFTPWSDLAGPGSYLATFVPEDASEPILDTFLGYWATFCYIAFGIWFLSRLWGAWHQNDFQAPRTTARAISRGDHNNSITY